MAGIEKLSNLQIRILDSVMLLRTKIRLTRLAALLVVSLTAAMLISACQQPEPTPTSHSGAANADGSRDAGSGEHCDAAA